MNKHADKTSENKSQSVANNMPKQQSSDKAPFHHLDNRPEAIAQRKLKDAIGRNNAVFTLKAKNDSKSAAQMRQVVQRVTTQILPGKEDGKIESISIVGRPPHTFPGSMGDHTTAFTMIASGLENQIKGKTVVQASATLGRLVHELYDLPGMKLPPQSLPIEHAERLNNALKKLHWFVVQMRNFRKNYNQNKSGFLNFLPPENEEYEFSAGLVSHMQNWIDTYLEARELVPMSTVNVKAINTPLAGKGKGESANTLVAAENGENVNIIAITRQIEGLFDARAAAVICGTVDWELLPKVAPGMFPTFEFEKRAELLVMQHFTTLQSLYPNVMKRLNTEEMAKHKIIDLLHWNLKKNIYEKHNENVEAQKKEKKQNNKKGTRTQKEGKRYLTTALNVNEHNIITDVKMGGRGTSPYSNTMGAHTSAWVVLTDSVWAGLVGKTLLQGAEIVNTLINQAIGRMVEMTDVMQSDEKQIHRIFQALEPIKVSQQKLLEMITMKQVQEQPTDTIMGNMDINEDKNEVPLENEQFTWYSPWEQVLILQESINSLLNYMNLTPGASLYVGNVNGAREGTYRGFLREHFHPHRNQNSNPDKAKTRQAILGLLDLKGLEQHTKTTEENLQGRKKHQYDPNLNMEGKGLYTEFYQSVQHDEPVAHNFDKILNLLVKHHFELIAKAYPGVLEYAELSVKMDLVQLAKESLLYSKDEGFEYEEEPDDEDDY
jgi:hypothetical protein